jgi:hypothetical protein
VSEFAETVIPDELRFAGRDPESSEVQYNKIFSGSRLAPAAGGLGRDDEL